MKERAYTVYTTVYAYTFDALGESTKAHGMNKMNSQSPQIPNAKICDRQSKFALLPKMFSALQRQEEHRNFVALSCLADQQTRLQCEHFSGRT